MGCKISHPNVLRCYGWFYNDRKVFLILEYAQNGNLFNKIEKYGSLNNNEAATVNLEISFLLFLSHKRILTI
jgi:hypothetical protein